MKYPILALLAAEPAHGYELKQRFESRFEAVWPPVNIGQVYTTLQRLERDSLVRGLDGADGDRPARHVYEITESGRTALAAWLAASSNGPRIRDDFYMKLVLSRLSGMAEPLELLERQRLALLQELRDLNALAGRPEHQETATQLLIEGAALHAQADLRWIDLCEERLQQGETL